MIRRRDQIRLSVQKLGLRKKRAVFSIISVALGVIVVVAVDSLIGNVRDVILKTSFTEDIDKDAIKVYAINDPYEFGGPMQDRKQQKQRRVQFLTESTFEEIRQWPHVEAADHPVDVQPVTIDAFAERPRPVTQVTGLPEPMLERYVKPPQSLAGCSNAIPLVVGERYVRLHYDAAKKKFLPEDADTVNRWIGRDVMLTVGDNYSVLSDFQFDYQKKQWNAVDPDDLAQQREAIDRSLREQYDPAIISTTLGLKGRIVGLCPGNQVLMPLEAAESCQKWITQRGQLALLHPASHEDDVEYGANGRETPRAGEYNEGIVLVKAGANAETVAEKIRKMGFQASTRASAFESFVKDLDAGIRIVKRISFAFGAVVLGIACGLLWNTTSRTVSDSRVDIGLFRALGATKGDIRRLFLSEAVLLGLLGTLAGMLMGWSVAFYISHWVLRAVRATMTDPEELLMVPNSIFTVDVQFCLTLLAGAAFVSLIAGLMPANRAARIDPVKALKRE
jgi:small basic protein